MEFGGVTAAKLANTFTKANAFTTRGLEDTEVTGPTSTSGVAPAGSRFTVVSISALATFTRLPVTRPPLKYCGCGSSVVPESSVALEAVAWMPAVAPKLQFGKSPASLIIVVQPVTPSVEI